MLLFNVDDLEEHAIAKFGSLSKMEDYILNKQTRSKNRINTKQLKSNERKMILINELSKVGCELRNDSKLCSAYIENNDGNPVYIAGIMCEMKFYYKHTQYERILDNLIDDAKEEQYYHGEYYDYNELSMEAKEIAITKFCKQFKQYSEINVDIPITLQNEIRGKIN